MQEVNKFHAAAWPSGKAGACKAFTPSSNLGAAFDFNYLLSSAIERSKRE